MPRDPEADEVSVTDATQPEGEPGAPEQALPEPAPAAQPPPALEAPSVEQLVGEIEELRDRHLRLAAEYDNFRRRTARERLDLRTRSQAELVGALLEALDDLGRVAHLDPAATNGADVIAGVELVERKLMRQLTGAGLERVAEAEVPFDPNQHEAIAAAPAESPEQDHTVANVFQVGYRFGGQMLRPARVQVRVWTGDADGGTPDA